MESVPPENDVKGVNSVNGASGVKGAKGVRRVNGVDKPASVACVVGGSSSSLPHGTNTRAASEMVSLAR